jgi:hypothetical protein
MRVLSVAAAVLVAACAAKARLVSSSVGCEPVGRFVVADSSLNMGDRMSRATERGERQATLLGGTAVHVDSTVGNLAAHRFYFTALRCPR